uniref:Uncharacterized protein n=1 Tax=Arundo donax TaxID=35708 RepID=A0A0A9DMV6_ARUDO
MIQRNISSSNHMQESLTICCGTCETNRVIHAANQPSCDDMCSCAVFPFCLVLIFLPQSVGMLTAFRVTFLNHVLLQGDPVKRKGKSF